MGYAYFTGTAPAAPLSDGPIYRADGYSLFAGEALVLFGPIEAVDKIAASLNAEPPAAGTLPLRIMNEIQNAGGGVFLPREGLRGQW